MHPRPPLLPNLADISNARKSGEVQRRQRRPAPEHSVGCSTMKIHASGVCASLQTYASSSSALIRLAGLLRNRRRGHYYLGRFLCEVCEEHQSIHATDRSGSSRSIYGGRRPRINNRQCLVALRSKMLAGVISPHSHLYGIANPQIELREKLARNLSFHRSSTSSGYFIV